MSETERTPMGEIYEATYHEMLMKQPKELQERILREKDKPSHFPDKDVMAFIRAVIAEAESIADNELKNEVKKHKKAPASTKAAK